MKPNLHIYIISILLCTVNSYAFEYANPKSDAKDDAPKAIIIARPPVKIASQDEDASSENVENSDDILAKLTDEYTQANSTLEKYSTLKNFENKVDKLPSKFEILNDVIFVQKSPLRFVIARKGEFVETLKMPTKIKFSDTLSSAYKIKRTYDRNRNDNLEEDEVISILLEMRMKFYTAKTDSDRQKVLDRYTEVLKPLNQEEFEVSWGNNSTFRIVKNPQTGIWSAPDEMPVQKYDANEHPSYKFLDELDKISELAGFEMLKELQKSNPLARPNLIVKLLPKYKSAKYPILGTKEFENRKILAQSGFDGFIEITNEKQELVLVPVFITDPENTLQVLKDFSNSNINKD